MSEPLRQWLYVAVVALTVALLHRLRRHFWVFSVLVLPGTFAHESCHYLMGILLGGRPSGFNLFPRREGHGYVMGSVSFTGLHWFNCFFIGLAPMLLLPAAYGLMRWRQGLGPVLGWEEALAVYAIANLVYAALPSWQDVRIAARSPIGWLLLAGGAGWAWYAYQHRAPSVRRGHGALVRVGLAHEEQQRQQHDA